MPLKILLVDDERLIREGLKKIISRMGKDYQVIGEAENGSVALQLISKTIPDVVITDIRMPVMNGVELVKKLRETLPSVRNVVLSGFEDYNYVRDTLKHGAIDYILKPIKNETIISLLKEIEATLELERQINIKRYQEEQKLVQSILFLRERFFTDWIKGDIEEVDRRAEEAGLAIQKMQMVLAILSVDSYYNLCNNAISNKFINMPPDIKSVVSGLIKSTPDFYFFSLEENEHIVIRMQSSINEAENTDIMKKILNVVLEKTGYSATIGLSDIYHDTNSLRTLYEEARKALSQRLYGYNGCVLKFREMKPYSLYTNYENNIRENSIIELIEATNLDELKTASRQMVTDMESLYMDPACIIKFLDEIIIRADVVLPEFREVLFERFHGKYYFAQNANKLDTMRNLKEYFCGILLDITRHIQLKRKEKVKKLIECAKEYIRKNYKEEISLNYMAEYFHMNPTYFSDFFKKETGENFIDYLTRVRIDQAKKFLADSTIKVYEVGYMVGYNDPAYFSRLFKKRVGISPSEFKEYC